MNNKLLALVFMSFSLAGTTFCQNKSNSADSEDDKSYEVSKSESEWKQQLSPEAFEVLRNKATEYAFTGKYYDFNEKGVFTCAGCGNELFDSKTKYNSGCGWPSFYQAVNEQAIKFELDKSLGTTRKEILCSKCGGHLGHVFEDGPQPTGLRYCVNSISLDFTEK